MGKKTVLGVDLGNDRLKLALMKDGRVKKAVNIPMPENMMRDGRVTSPDAMADLIRAAVKQNHLWATRAALVLPDEPLYLRTLFMPPMNEEQLRKSIEETTRLMKEAAKELNFIQAAQYRDEIIRLQDLLDK